MRRFLCWIGWHDWAKPYQIETVEIACCHWCGWIKARDVAADKAWSCSREQFRQGVEISKKHIAYRSN